MTTLKARLQPMLHRSIKTLLVLCMIMMSGCTKVKEENWTWEMWLKNLSIQAGFSTSESEAISDLISFDVIDVSVYALDALLTAAMVKVCAESLIDDADELNLDSYDENHILSASQGQKILDELIERMNDFSEERFEVVYEKEPVHVTVLNQRDNRYWIAQNVDVNDLVVIEGLVYQVVNVEEQWIEVRDVSFDHIDELDLQGSVSLNLNEATTIVKNEVIEISETTGAGLSAPALSQSFQVQGFQVRISASSDSLHVYASKKMESGQPVFVQFDINEVQCDFKWKSTKNQVEASALKVSYETSLTSGLRSTDFNDRVLDFSKMDTQQLISSLKNGFVRKEDALMDSIELCEIQLPVPQLPTVMLKMKVLLHLYASGKAEIGFESDQTAGFECINGKLRLIHDTQKDAYFSVRASAKASTKLQFILSAFMKDLMDATVELGVQGNALTKIQMDNHSFSTDVSYEVMEEVSDEKMKVCADLDAFWLLNLALNSSRTLLGSYGISYDVDLINQANGSLFGQSIHLENFQRVDKCTQDLQLDELEVKVNLDRIELKQYLLILNEDESQRIEISALPFGTEKKDVRYSSSNSDVAIVNSNGIVKALKSGNAIITVSLMDGSYAAQCSIFVR